jgi:acetyl esterase/lipase
MRKYFLIGFLLISTQTWAQSASPVKHLFPAGTVFHENINYANDEDPKHLLDIYLPSGNKKNLPLVVWIHGGAWMMNDKYADMGYMKETVRSILEKGYAFASIDYRHSTTKPFPAQIQDCNQAIQWLYDHADQYGIQKKKIALIGFSAGGHLASLIGLSANNKVPQFTHNGKPTTFKISLVIDFYGPSDLIALASDTITNQSDHPITKLLGSAAVDRPDLAKAASPVTYIDGKDPAFLIIQGEKDESVSNIQSRYLHSWLQLSGLPSKIIMVPGAPHYGEMFDAETIRQELFVFLGLYL